MSQWVRVTSKVMENVERDLMEKTFDKMHLKMDGSVHKIENPWGTDNVDFALRDMLNSNRLLSIGMVHDNKKLEVRGDFFGSRWRDEKVFADEFSQTYQRLNIEEAAMVNGYNVESESVTEDGSIELYLTSNAF